MSRRICRYFQIATKPQETTLVIELCRYVCFCQPVNVFNLYQPALPSRVQPSIPHMGEMLGHVLPHLSHTCCGLLFSLSAVRSCGLPLCLPLRFAGIPW